MSKSADHAAEALQAILSAISRDDLIAELVSREGVARHDILNGGPYRIQREVPLGMEDLEAYHGPVTIITVDGES